MRRHPPRPVSVFLGAALLVGGVVVSAQAFVAPHQNLIYEIHLQEFDLHGFTTPAIETARAQAAALVSQRYGGRWRVYAWNPQSDTPANLYGSGIEVAPPFAGPGDAEPAAREVLAANAVVLGLDPTQLVLDDIGSGLGKIGVHFQQTYAGLEVWEGRAHVTLTESGRLIEMGSTYYTGIGVDPNPTLPATAAAQIARNGLPFDSATDQVEAEIPLMVLPVPLSETVVEHHLVWRVRVHTRDPIGIWVTHVDAHTGAILWRWNDVHFIDLVGRSEADVQPDTYCNGEETQGAAHMELVFQGFGGTTTDANGDFVHPHTGTADVNVSAELFGPYVNVNNNLGLDASFEGTLTPGVPFTVTFDDSNAQQDERDVYDGVNDVHEFFLLFDPTFGYINRRMIANVSVVGSCNAFWNGTINFYIATPTMCANTGEIQGVVHHEFGHGVQDFILGSQGGQGLGEGNSDILANLITRESIIGRGFELDCTAGIRDSKNSLQYPADVLGQGVHDAGRVIAGFNWDMMELLQAVYGEDPGLLEATELWHFGRLIGRPTTQPSQVFFTFVADDDDGNLDNGTPNYDAICTAANNHGFDCPEVSQGIFITHDPVETTTVEGDVDIVAEIVSTLAALDPTALELFYSVDGGLFQTASLTATANPDEYAATLSGLTQPTEIVYYIQAADQLGNTDTHPTFAPAFVHAFDIALVWDTMETPTGWSVNAEGTDDALSGVWERVDPTGDGAAQPEDDHSLNGVTCWVTGQGTPGGALGENDVDNGTTTLFSTAYDLTDAIWARVKYWRWYSDNLGAEPNTDPWIVQTRNDGGPWMDIENTFSAQNLWVQIDVELTEVLGADLGLVEFKFIASDVGVTGAGASVLEAAVDDFEILARFTATGIAGDAPAAPARYALLRAIPNPTAGGTSIRFEVPRVAPVTLTIYDVVGRSLRTLVDAPLQAGRHTIRWDGTDAGGRPVASGVYYYRLSAPDFSGSDRIVLMR